MHWKASRARPVHTSFVVTRACQKVLDASVSLMRSSTVVRGSDSKKSSTAADNAVLLVGTVKTSSFGRVRPARMHVDFGVRHRFRPERLAVAARVHSPNHIKPQASTCKQLEFFAQSDSPAVAHCHRPQVSRMGSGL